MPKGFGTRSRISPPLLFEVSHRLKGLLLAAQQFFSSSVDWLGRLQMGGKASAMN